MCKTAVNGGTRFNSWIGSTAGLMWRPTRQAKLLMLNLLTRNSMGKGIRRQKTGRTSAAALMRLLLNPMMRTMLSAPHCL
jgi:hypothetical protein